jgi:hypothetical protein
MDPDDIYEIFFSESASDSLKRQIYLACHEFLSIADGTHDEFNVVLAVSSIKSLDDLAYDVSRIFDSMGFDSYEYNIIKRYFYYNGTFLLLTYVPVPIFSNSNKFMYFYDPCIENVILGFMPQKSLDSILQPCINNII